MENLNTKLNCQQLVFFFKQILEKEVLHKRLDFPYVGVITVTQLYELMHIKWSIYIKNSQKHNYISTLVGSAQSSGIYNIY